MALETPSPGPGQPKPVRQAHPPVDCTAINLAQLFRHRSDMYADRVRWRQQRAGIWARATFRENRRIVTELISALDALGVRRGDAVAILSSTRWEWMAADWAIMGVGGVTVPIDAANTPATTAWILEDSGARYAFLENRRQYDKLAAVRHQLPHPLRVILFDDAEQVGGDPCALSFASLRQLSRQAPEAAEAFAAARAALIEPDDRAALVYTSGTTGQPKGVIQTHRMLLALLAGVRPMLTSFHPGMRDALFLPLSHVFGRLEHLLGVDRGAETVVVSSLFHLGADLRAAQPDVLLGPPRVYEEIYAAILARVGSGPRLYANLQRGPFEAAVRVGRAAAYLRQDHRRLPLRLRLPLAVADRLVFRRVRAALGGRLQFAITAGAPIDRTIVEFFCGAGVLLLEAWGLTETGAPSR